MKQYKQNLIDGSSNQLGYLMEYKYTKAKMKKCPYCGTIFEGNVCPTCGD